MKKILLIYLVALSPFTAFCQTAVLGAISVDGVRSEGFNLNTDIEGSPFLKDEWIEGTATNNIGEVYKAKYKYDIYKDHLIFAGDNDAPMLFLVPITTFTLDGKVYTNGFPAFDNLGTATYYEVLNQGKTQLLKRTYKSLLDIRDNTVMVIGHRYENNTAYFLYKDKKITHIKIGKGNILSALSDKQAQMDEYIKANKIDFKNDADLGKLFDHYNAL